MHVFILLTVIGSFPVLSGTGTCGNGWEQLNDTCYMYVHDYLDWTDADRYCEKQNDAYLVMIKSPAEQSFIEENRRSRSRYWIGFTNDLDGIAWEYADGELVYGYTNWKEGQPINKTDRDNCAYISFTRHAMGKWSNVDCIVKMYFICQGKATKKLNAA